ncbi:hypothetical protein G6F63_014738 [Rhizopus arrhizus]|nr:hypothetical protein G6F63_014738 [Rhizopus arrhizus]
MALSAAGIGAPARGQLAADFQLDALGGDAVRGGVCLLERARHQRVAIQHGDLALLDLEQRDGGIQPAIQVFALHAHFVVLALHRIQVIAVAVAVVLRLEDIGVADVGRIGVVDVVHQAGSV